MITTVTLNPMLDKTVRLSGITVGGITRATRVESIVGGKGVNVARQLTRLHCPVRATGLWGGEVGDQLARLLTGEGVLHDFFRIGSMTREGVTYLDAGGIATSVFEPPHDVTDQEVDAFLAHCLDLMGTSDWIACCGSSPCVVCDGVYAEILRHARARKVRTALDTYGASLRLALDTPPDLLKVNREEYQNTIGVALDRESHIVDALVTFVEQGVGLAVLTDGPRPCYAASASGCWKITPPSVTSVNPTGSGDSMLAGILYGLSRGWDAPKCASLGAAAGAANASVWGVSSSSLEDIVARLPRVAVAEIDFL
jgi:1-phosphofructokinase family hexose kinase